ncbi:hypothetical protein PsorP6_003991 [Peronosclerospora sorghi]|uniref:Uncharacterized protein n=1 Tax=Peronosclerospora sorghi TaxID=230839 RepID=A0ACC0VM40_9STRA|nr:hypothetical protein PsorP6_003991 [Peronosclerospora sorghi]
MGPIEPPLKGGANHHILNRIPNTAWRDTCPIEIVDGILPVLDYLRVFGSEGFHCIGDSKRTNATPKAHRCLFLGYSGTFKAYIVWDLEDERIVTVVLDERPPSS